ncbi:MAG: 50S ribosomal protein L24 [Nanoarchaeota archaeon]|nr:50S ribosomal protein L24 [Nanoarchaeota archaeon]MBU1855131.1 50S ribosomal protein L24 [Nanoarchaeota archaeon]
MKKNFSKNWISSKQPRKQRKYLAKAPLHLKSKLLNVHLSKELRTKHKRRSIRVRVGDKVKILRGNYKGEEHKVEKVNVKNQKVYLEKIELSKKDGSKAIRPFSPSNLMITALNTDDKKRLLKLKGVRDEVSGTSKNKNLIGEKQ